MKRAIRRFVGSLTGTRKYIFFVVLVLICIVAMCLGIYAQFFYKYADTDIFMIGINIGAKKTAEEIDILKSNFNSLFNNSLVVNSEEIKASKIEKKNDYVYTGYNLINEDENYYSVNVQVPVINIDSDKAREINSKIKTEFYDIANNIMRRTEGNTIYTVSYAAFINNDVLSLVIKSSLKETNKSEKLIVKTYNYAISEDREISLNDLITLKGTTKEDVQKTIDNDIKTAYTNAKIIAEQFGNLYERDLSSDIYKVDNTSTFFLTQDGYVYIVYAYGNNDYTTEMDLIIF